MLQFVKELTMLEIPQEIARSSNQRHCYNQPGGQYNYLLQVVFMPAWRRLFMSNGSIVNQADCWISVTTGYVLECTSRLATSSLWMPLPFQCILYTDIKKSKAPDRIYQRSQFHDGVGGMESEGDRSGVAMPTKCVPPSSATTRFYVREV